MNYDFNIPVSYTPEDNESYINKAEIIIKDCASFFPTPNECDICNNDDSYCQPFIQGDKIYLQFKFDSSVYDSFDYKIVNSETGEEIQSSAVQNTQGLDDDLSPFVDYIIDTGSAYWEGLSCWYFKFLLIKESDPGSSHDFLSTQPYCEARCNEHTLLIEGTYTKHDCDGNYYGNFIFNGQENIYKHQFRVRGVVEPNGYTFEETKNNIRKIKGKQIQLFLFRTEKIPYFVAKQIAIAFNAQSFYVDGVKYNGSLKLDKDFDEGSEWIINETITIDCDEINFTCN